MLKLPARLQRGNTNVPFLLESLNEKNESRVSNNSLICFQLSSFFAYVYCTLYNAVQTNWGACIYVYITVTSLHLFSVFLKNPAL